MLSSKDTVLSSLRIIDDFAGAKELELWQDKIHRATRQGTPIKPWNTSLWQKIRRLINLPLTRCDLYVIESNDHNNIHRDQTQYSAIFYPFNSTGSLAIYEEDHRTIKGCVEIKANRLVLFACSEQYHSQVPPQTGKRYSVVFKFSTK